MILCLGTTPAMARTMIFPALKIDDVNRASKVIEHPAGKSVNAAKVVHALGEDVQAVGFAGGLRGKELVASLKHLGLRYNFVPIESDTRLCVTVVDESTRRVTELVQETAPVEKDGWTTIRKTLAECLLGASLLVLSGTVAPGGPADFYATCIEMAGKANIRTIVDASGIQLQNAMPMKPALIKPNRHELQATLNRSINSEAQLLDAMREMLNRGAGAIVVSMGADGLVAMDATGTWRIRVPKIQVVSAIGSGDSLCGGIAVGMNRKLSLPESCKLGAACAVVNALSPVSGHVTRTDVEQMLPQIKVEMF